MFHMYSSHAGFQAPKSRHAKLEQERAKKRHKEALARVKPRINNKPPRRFPHLQTRQKKMANLRQRYTTIERDNRILLQKMANIMERPNFTDVDPHRNWPHESLHQPYRQQQERKIIRENYAMLGRIRSTTPQLNARQWDRDWEQHEKYLTNICEYDNARVEQAKKVLAYGANSRPATSHGPYGRFDRTLPSARGSTRARRLAAGYPDGSLTSRTMDMHSPRSARSSRASSVAGARPSTSRKQRPRRQPRPPSRASSVRSSRRSSRSSQAGRRPEAGQQAAQETTPAKPEQVESEQTVSQSDTDKKADSDHDDKPDTSDQDKPAEQQEEEEQPHVEQVYRGSSKIGERHVIVTVNAASQDEFEFVVYDATQQQEFTTTVSRSKLESAYASESDDAARAKAAIAHLHVDDDAVVWDADREIDSSAVPATDEKSQSDQDESSESPVAKADADTDASQQQQESSKPAQSGRSQDDDFEVIVTVIRAENLHDADLGGKSDAYVKLSFDGDSVKQTKVESGSLNPVWNESLTLTHKAGTGIVLFGSVMDEDLGSDDELGYTRYDLAQYANTDEEIALDITHDDKPAGKLFIKISFP